MNERSRPMATIGDALAGWLARSGLTRRFEQAQVVADWAEMVGPQIASVTEPESVTPDGVLRVRVATAPWAAELGLMTPRILARLNAGRRARITEIRWIAGRSGRP